MTKEKEKTLSDVGEGSKKLKVSKRKQNRRNIKQISDSDVNDETKALQQAEADRQKRLQNVDDELEKEDALVADLEADQESVQDVSFNGTTKDEPIIVEEFDGNLHEDYSDMAVVIELGEEDDEDEDEPEIIETEVCEIRDAENLPDEEGNILINKSKKKNEEPIYLARHLVPVIKPHQVSGVRFMFENIAESSKKFNETPGFGCILAHSMGLGKTIQVVSFTDLLFRYCNAHHVLIIVPINTIQNWKSEFDRWLPKKQSKKSTSSCEENSDSDSESDEEVASRKNQKYNRNFDVYIIQDSNKTLQSRYNVIKSWVENQGVLLIGYEMFRLLAFPKVSKIDSEIESVKRKARRPKKSSPDDSDESDEASKKAEMLQTLKEALIDPGPQVVICDEGHRIKNSEASTSKALKSIRTRRRVVLTGYPLQNNLLEYWCMVDFVRPKYLGTKQEFMSMFQRPIENGQCIDSTDQDRKIMQGRAHVLHDLLQGFVQRRSHMVLKASLPEKKEVVIFIKMSPFQRHLYATYMEYIRTIGNIGIGSMNVLRTYAMGCKIWNHPDILRRAMNECEEAFDLDFDGLIQNGNSSSTRSASASAAKSKKKPKKTDKTPAPTKQESEVTTPAEMPAQIEPPANQIPLDVKDEVEEIIIQDEIELPTQSTFVDSAQSIPENLSPYSMTYTSGSPTTFQGSQSSSSYDLASQVAMSFRGTSSNPRTQYANDITKYKPRGPLVDTKKFFTEFMNSKNQQGNPTKPQFQQHQQQLQQQQQPIVAQKYPNYDDPMSTYDWANNPHVWTLNDLEYMEGVIENSGKIAILMDIIHESLAVGDKLLVFSQSLLTLNLLEKFLSMNPYSPPSESDDNKTVKWVKNKTYFRLDGSTTASERERQILKFNDPKGSLKLFLISTRAGCLGINLIGANRVVVFDASWNPCHDCQAVCRVYRYGQQKKCFIYRLISDNTMERKIYDRQVTKQSMSNRVVDEMNPTQQFTRSQVEQLMQFDDVDQPCLKDEEIVSCETLTSGDEVLEKVVKKNKQWITKVPFTHESLLIDRKECSLTKVEKRMARQSYELEKKTTNRYATANQYHAQQMKSIHHIQQLQMQAHNPNFGTNHLDIAELQRQFKWAKDPKDMKPHMSNILSKSRKTMDAFQTLPSGGIVLQPEKYNPIIRSMREQDKQDRVKMFQKEIEQARQQYLEQMNRPKVSAGSKRKQALNTQVEGFDDNFNLTNGGNAANKWPRLEVNDYPYQLPEMYQYNPQNQQQQQQHQFQQNQPQSDLNQNLYQDSMSAFYQAATAAAAASAFYPGIDNQPVNYHNSNIFPMNQDSLSKLQD